MVWGFSLHLKLYEAPKSKLVFCLPSIREWPKLIMTWVYFRHLSPRVSLPSIYTFEVAITALSDLSHKCIVNLELKVKCKLFLHPEVINNNDIIQQELILLILCAEVYYFWYSVCLVLELSIYTRMNFIEHVRTPFSKLAHLLLIAKYCSG